MHLAIDMLGARHAGAAMVAVDVLEAAIASPRVTRLSVFASPHAERAFVMPSAPKVQVYEPRALGGPLGRVGWSVRGLSAQAAAIGADRLLALGNIGLGAMPTTVLIQQSLPFSTEALARMSQRQRLRLAVIRKLMRLSATRARRVIVQTPTMREWVQRSLRISPELISVFAPGPPELPAAASASSAVARLRTQPAGGRLLYVGNDSAYKNVGVLGEALARLRALERTASITAVLPESHGLASRGVLCVGSVNRAELHALYRDSDVLVMPSLVETVGLPMLEAMACGVPVLAADRPYAHDVCGEAAIYFDPLAPDDLARRAAEVIQDRSLRERLVSAGRRLVAERLAARPYAGMIDAALDAR